MADRVIIIDVNRGKHLVDISVLKQMEGRSGRKEKEGNVDYIVCEDVYDDFMEAYKDVENLNVKSVFNDNIHFHLIGEIALGNVFDLNSFQKWYENSFAYYQGNKINYERVIKELLEIEAIKECDNSFIINYIGELSNRFYFDPNDIYLWKENFKYIIEEEIFESDFAKAWALSNIKGMSLKGDVRKYFEAIDEYNAGINGLGLTQSEGRTTSGIVWHSFLGGRPTGKLISCLKEVKDNKSRIISVLKSINYYEKWNKDEYFADLDIQLSHKVDSSLVFLCKIPSMKKSLAQYLYNERNVRSYHDLMSEMQDLKDMLDNNTFISIREFLLGKING